VQQRSRVSFVSPEPGVLRGAGPRRTCLPAILVALAAIALPPAAFATTVALVGADEPADVTLVGDALVGTGLFSAADITELAGTATPDLATLAPHDVVLLWADIVWDDPVTLGDVLADYVDGGGAVVMATHALEAAWRPAGRFEDDGYPPFEIPATASVAGDIDFASPSTDPTHPILDGLSAVTFPDRSQGWPTLAFEGDLVGVDTLANNVVATTCLRDVIAVNVFPPDLALGEPSTSADAVLMMAQALDTTQLDAAPEASAGGPYPVDEGGSVTLDAGGSLPGDLGPLFYSWDLDGDGLYGDSTAVDPVFDASALSGPSTHDIAVRVADSCGRMDWSTTTVEVANVAPTLDSIGEDGPVDEGSPVTLTAAASDAGPDTLTWTWDPGDGSPTIDGATASHTYAEDGTWTATVTVDDGDGGTATGSVDVQVNNVAPTIASLGSNGPKGEAAAVALTASATDPGSEDVLTYAWDFGDGSPAGSGASVSHAWTDDATWTVTLTVTDDDGGTVSDTLDVVITNVAPSIDTLSNSGPIAEGGSVDLSGAASDPGDDALTPAWDFGDGSPAGTGWTASHVYDDDGPWTVTLTVDDGDGGITTGQTTVQVNNVAPTLEALTGDGAGELGEALAFAGVASDPGADTITWSWTWGDGSPADAGVDLSSVAHAWTAPATYAVHLVVQDDDGGSTEADLTVSITDQGPTLSFVSGPTDMDEATSGSWTVAAAGPLGETVDVAWSWADGSPVSSGSGLVTASHAWDDDGAYDVEVSATDAWGEQATLTVPVTVLNLDPEFVTLPQAAGSEGTAYQLVLSAQDVPADQPDLVLVLLTSPLGTSFDPTAGTISWLPAWPDSQTGPHAFEAIVADGDGGSDTLSWQVAVGPLDADGDGMPDGWELTHGLDPTVDDSAGDADADGISNLDEWLADGDPQSYDGPGQPVALSPIDGQTVITATPTLLVQDAPDPSGDPLTYDFEIYEDAALLSLVDQATGVSAGGGGTTSWTVGVALTEDALAWWRARASDGFVAGAWTVAEPLFVDQGNGAPSMSQPIWPVDTTVDTPVPVLVASSSSDPEGEPVTVMMGLYDSSGALIEAIDAVEQPDGTWEGVPTTPLPEEADYSWTAEATDVVGLDSGASTAAEFHVDVTNGLPDAPLVVAPTDGEEIDTDLPTIVVEAGGDVDGDPVLVRITVDLQDDFASPDRQDLGPVEPGPDGLCSVDLLAALPENSDVWARARTEDDRGGASAWTTWSFHVDALPEAPAPVRVTAPGEDESVDGAAVLVRWAVTTDPDDDPLTYDLEIAALPEPEARDFEEPVWSATGLLVPDGEIEGEVEVDVALPEGAWLVHARAVDSGELAGPWGPDNRFVVLPVADEPVDLDPGEGPYGCDCASAVMPGRVGSLLWFGVLLGGVLVRRRRCCR
jgi:PKD repeat protein